MGRMATNPAMPFCQSNCHSCVCTTCSVGRFLLFGLSFGESFSFQLGSGCYVAWLLQPNFGRTFCLGVVTIKSTTCLSGFDMLYTDWAIERCFGAHSAKK
eukprot:Lithocolla_globosa_v1_NODE_755_length_3330_cov_7.142290.p4 type:complete len:100 gc:universal NODE_755_length_3330_cov_7.142290:653-354(-)